MARISVDDCLKHLGLFRLIDGRETLVAPYRARQITLGSTPQVQFDKDKPTVIALREIAAGKVGLEILNRSQT